MSTLQGTRAAKLAPVDVASPAPPLAVERWFNAPADYSLTALRGRVVVLHAFQMLCPGCVAHGIPQAKRIAETFDFADVQVVGLHTVFEHHAAMNADALEAFIHEYRVDFPVGVDLPAASGPTPQTMTKYRMRGTPSLLLIDREGRLRSHIFGRPEDLAVGAAVATLIGEPYRSVDVGCEGGVCELDAG